MVEQNEGIVLKKEIEHPIIPRTEFPNIIYDIFRDGLGKSSTIVLKQIDIVDDLLMLDPGVFIRRTSLKQVVKKFS